MKIDVDKIKESCIEQGFTLTEALDRAGVSRNAFYTLARKKNLLPKTVSDVAEALGLEESEILRESLTPEAQVRKLYQDVERIVSKETIHEPDNVRLTLQLLEKQPIERLRTALTRGQQFNFQ